MTSNSLINQIFCIIFLSSISFTSAAEIYKITNPDGSVSFSDQPAENAEAISTQPVQQYSSPHKAKNTAKKQQTKKTADNPEKSDKPISYTKLEIISPKNDSAVRANDGTVTVTVKATPPLNHQQGDKIQVFLNGAPAAPPAASTSFTLTNLNRGTHSISASLKNAQGATLLSAPTIKFHVLKASAR